MKKIECTCTFCGKNFLKPKNEYNRRVKLGKTQFFCSLKCGGKNIGLSNFKGQQCKIPIRKQPNFKEQVTNPFKYYLRRCRARYKHNMDLNLEYLEKLWHNQKGLCSYTGLKLNLQSSTKYNLDKRFAASLDRIDSNLGYIKGNVQFVSTCINLMKNNLSHEETIEFIKILKKVNKNVNPVCSTELRNL